MFLQSLSYHLKRKASGAQKRYEDKIKGRKKAEIEAKKAAIRAEDIAKGVFVPGHNQTGITAVKTI